MGLNNLSMYAIIIFLFRNIKTPAMYCQSSNSKYDATKHNHKPL